MNKKLLQRPYAWLLLGGLLCLFSCRTYNDAIGSYYGAIAQGRFDDAAMQLDKNKFLKYRRNQLLFCLEKGKTAFLQGQYAESNLYFNQADSLLESGGRNKAMDQALGLLTNPAMQQYRGEDFEKLLIHYYKSLNYMQLHMMEDAEVEARRISLSGYELNDRKNNRENRYSNDAFAMIIQGMVYESAGDINNAFIAYRNAADLFLRQEDHTYYGIPLPQQLQEDVLRTAAGLGFETERAYYARAFGNTRMPVEKQEGGEVMVFWENGLAPVKAEANFFFTLTERGPGNFGFTDGDNSLFIPFDFNLLPRDSCYKLRRHFEAFRVAFPKYVEQPLYYTGASIQRDSTLQVQMEKVEDINRLAFSTLQERFMKELGLALTRMAIKKLAEQQIKKENESLGEAFNLLSILAEKADTRNWQSLPHTIYYSRIPLKKGQNKLVLTLKGASTTQQVEFEVYGNGGLQTIHYSSLQKS
ncbi:COG3014 family protein [Chitinophaga arvensicola]|uniref:Tetratricopeptide repeat-containing protein n=1 Tax=Chitinophaga arvensicola TaxID=29529 RepID=A0A1I0R933_9BACT|nr:hypothetical protein [Chitinophaga arvensicola]SEW37303.1 hypothetical protein SAMN04488122_2493 [Chitinophaga arvensicola]